MSMLDAIINRAAEVHPVVGYGLAIGTVAAELFREGKYKLAVICGLQAAACAAYFVFQERVVNAPTPKSTEEFCEYDYNHIVTCYAGNRANPLYRLDCVAFCHEACKGLGGKEGISDFRSLQGGRVIELA